MKGKLLLVLMVGTAGLDAALGASTTQVNISEPSLSESPTAYVDRSYQEDSLIYDRQTAIPAKNNKYSFKLRPRYIIATAILLGISVAIYLKVFRKTAKPKDPEGDPESSKRVVKYEWLKNLKEANDKVKKRRKRLKMAGTLGDVIFTMGKEISKHLDEDGQQESQDQALVTVESLEEELERLEDGGVPRSFVRASVGIGARIGKFIAKLIKGIEAVIKANEEELVRHDMQGP